MSRFLKTVSDVERGIRIHIYIYIYMCVCVHARVCVCVCVCLEQCKSFLLFLVSHLSYFQSLVFMCGDLVRCEYFSLSVQLLADRCGSPWLTGALLTMQSFSSHKFYLSTFLWLGWHLAKTIACLFQVP